MRLLLRLRVDRGRATVQFEDRSNNSADVGNDSAVWRDLEVHAAADVTVAELTEALHSYVGTGPGWEPCTLRSSHGTLPPSERVADVGPPSGGNVEFAPLSDVPAPSQNLSPVVLVDLNGLRHQLPYGMTAIDDAELHVGDAVTVRRPTPGPVAINGLSVLGPRTLAHGDLLRTHGAIMTVVIDGPLRPPSTRGAHQPHQGAPVWTVTGELPEAAPVSLPEPPQPVRPQGFPVLSAMVPLLMGIGLWWITRSAASSVFVLFSCVFVIAAALESRREAAAERRFRLTQFHAHLDAAIQELTDRTTALQHHHQLTNPSSSELISAPDFPERLWGHHALMVRLGTGPVARADLVHPTERPAVGLRAQILAASEKFARPTLPVVVDLADTNGLLVLGSPAAAERVMRSAVVQIATTVSPTRCGLSGGPDRPWLAWLPHSESSSAVTTVVNVLDPDAGGGHCGASSAPLLWAGSSLRFAPPNVNAVLLIEADGTSAVLRQPGQPDQPLVIEGLAEREAHIAARSLAQYTDHDPQQGAALPEFVALSDVTSGGPLALTTPTEIQRRWARSSVRGGLAAPIGWADSTPIHLDLTSDGPHALIAGTTGAGKSELLRTLVSSMAAHHAPDRCTFLLIDYKGGAAFGALESLPHVVGMVTDLNEELAQRALVALRAEVRQRERTALASPHIPPPALVVIVDEFAALSRELPEFVEGLLDVAQRGRSLGLHLVLATQHPRGVVSDAIRANMALRIALRTTDSDASIDIVGHDAAAFLPRGVPGRSIVSTGPDQSVTVQTAFTGGSIGSAQRLIITELGQPRPPLPPATEATQLDSLVTAIRRAASETTPPQRPWCEPLPSDIPLADLPVVDLPGHIVVGLVDRPDRQRIEPLSIDFTVAGGAAIVGAPGSGRSTALNTLIWAWVTHPSEVAHVDVIDGDNAHAEVEFHRAVGSVIALSDTERSLRLLRSLSSEIEARRAVPSAQRAPVGSPNAPRRILIVDDLARFDALHDVISRGLGTSLLTQIAADGPPVGVHVVISARRSSEIGPALGAALRCRVVLRPIHSEEASLLGLPEHAADPANPPGRGHLGLHSAHIARATNHPSEWNDSRPTLLNARPEAAAVRTLPTAIQFADRASELSPWCIPIGWHADTLNLTHLRLDRDHAVVSGPSGSGVTTTLRTIASRVNATRVLITSSFVTQPNAMWDLILSPEDDLIASLPSAKRCLICIDEAERLLDSPSGTALDASLVAVLDERDTPDHQIRIVLGGNSLLLGRLYAESWMRIRATRTGISLQPEPDRPSPLAISDFPLRQELPNVPGRGWLSGPAGHQPLQVALPIEPHIS